MSKQEEAVEALLRLRETLREDGWVDGSVAMGQLDDVESALLVALAQQDAPDDELTDREAAEYGVLDHQPQQDAP